MSDTFESELNCCIPGDDSSRILVKGSPVGESSVAHHPLVFRLTLP
jgi:hypothetical protein